jgi:hypothetical protein
MPDDKLSAATGLLAGIFDRNRDNSVGQACILALALKAYLLHLRIPGVMPADQVLAGAVTQSSLGAVLFTRVQPSTPLSIRPDYTRTDRRELL